MAQKPPQVEHRQPGTHAPGGAAEHDLLRNDPGCSQRLSQGRLGTDRTGRPTPKRSWSRRPTSGIHIRGMDRNTVILDGEHKTGTGSCRKGERRLGRKHDGPRFNGTAAIWWTGGDGFQKTESPRLVRQVPDRLRDGPERRLRHLHPERAGRLVGTRLRLGLQRLGALHRRLLGMPGAGERRHDRKKLGRLLGLELRRPAGDRKIDLPGQRRRHRAERGKPR